jgi:hypothetical protein
MSTIDDVEGRLRERADAGHPESWVPKPGDELTGKVIRYSKAFTSRGTDAYVMVVESLRSPGRLASVWLLHTTLRNEVNAQQPRPGEIVYLRYDGLQKPKHGGDEYHGWKLVVDRDEASSPDLPWESSVDPRTAADAIVPPDTRPPHQPEPDGWPADAGTPVDDEIPF